VVVDDIKGDGQAATMTGVDKLLEGIGTSVGLMDGVPKDAVVAPVPLPVEIVDGQELDVGDAQIARWSRRSIALMRVPAG